MKAGMECDGLTPPYCGEARLAATNSTPCASSHADGTAASSRSTPKRI